MDLTDFLSPGTAKPLKMERILAEMDETTRGTVEQALRGPAGTYPAKTIATVLTRNGWQVSDTAVISWRDRYVETVQDG